MYSFYVFIFGPECFPWSRFFLVFLCTGIMTKPYRSIMNTDYLPSPNFLFNKVHGFLWFDQSVMLAWGFTDLQIYHFCLFKNKFQSLIFFLGIYSQILYVCKNCFWLFRNVHASFRCFQLLFSGLNIFRVKINLLLLSRLGTCCICSRF